MTNSKSCLPLKTTLYTNSFLYITSFRHVNITITNDSRCCGNYKITCYQTNQREYSQRYYAMANASDIIKQKSAFCLVCTCCSVDHVCYVAFWQRSSGCKQKKTAEELTFWKACKYAQVLYNNIQEEDTIPQHYSN